MATGVDSLGQFQWGDLVQLEYVDIFFFLPTWVWNQIILLIGLIQLHFSSPQTVGTIVRLERENFQILNMHGKVNIQ